MKTKKEKKLKKKKVEKKNNFSKKKPEVVRTMFLSVFRLFRQISRKNNENIEKWSLKIKKREKKYGKHEK